MRSRRSPFKRISVRIGRFRILAAWFFRLPSRMPIRTNKWHKLTAYTHFAGSISERCVGLATKHVVDRCEQEGSRAMLAYAANRESSSEAAEGSGFPG